MLTNLDFLNKGEKFPPSCEMERLEMYEANKRLFRGGHADVYKSDLERIERVIDNFRNVVSYPVIMNFQKLMSLKIADLLLGEPPQITTADEMAADQDTIDFIVRDSDLMNIASEVAIDVSRYGDGLFEVFLQDGVPKIGLTQPPIWFPVVDPNNTKRIVYHVLAWKPNEERLIARIHSQGSYEEREMILDHDTIVNYATTPKVVKTGLSDFAIIQVSNVTASDSVTGLDDYTDIDSIIGDLMVRIGQIDRILDKHASPSMTGPASALERDENGLGWRLKAANYFPRASSEDPEVSYITWDGQLAANFQQVERLINLLYSLSEMGSALMGESSGNTGQVLTASALRIKLAVPLAKVARIRMRFDPALKKAIALCSELGSGLKKLEQKDISIKWFDGLPTDDKEDAGIMATRTGNKATMSQYRALMVYDNMTEEEAAEEMERIREDEEFDAPMKAPDFSQDDILPKDGSGEVLDDDQAIS
jgi:hypothetical protein